MSEIVENNAPILDDAIPMDGNESIEEMQHVFKKAMEYASSDDFLNDCEETAKTSNKSAKEIFVGTIKIIGNKIAEVTHQVIEWTGNVIQKFCGLVKSILSKTVSIIKKAYYAIKGFFLGLIHEEEVVA